MDLVFPRRLKLKSFAQLLELDFASNASFAEI